MASEILSAVTRAAASTGGGSQDFTFTPDSGVSNWTPKLAIFKVQQVTADGTTTNNASLCIGAVSGASNLGCVFGFSDNGAAACASTRNLRNDRVMLIRNGSGTAILSATFTSFISNGVRINWSTTPAAAYLVTVEFWGGADFQASVDVVTLSTQNTAVDVTAPGFQPTLLRTLFASVAHNSSSNDDFAVCEGVALPSGTQLCWSTFDTDAADPSATLGAVYSNRCAAQVAGTTYTVEASSFDSQGYSLTARDAGSASDQIIGIAMNTGSLGVYVGAFDSPTTTGSHATTALGFKPQIVGLMGQAVTSMDSISTGGGGSAVFTSIIRANAQYTNRFSIEDNQATTDTEQESDDIAVKLSDDAGTALHAATLTSFDATGFTLNYSAANGTTRKWICWAVEAIRYTATSAALTIASLDFAATATFTPPTFTATAALTIPSPDLAASGSVTQPTYHGTAALTIPSPDLAASGSVTQPTFSASAALTIPAPDLAASGSVTQPTFAATAALQISSLDLEASGDVDQPVYTGSATLTIPAIDLEASGDVDQPTYSATAALQIPSLDLTASAEFDPPVYLGSAAFTLPALAFAGTGTTQKPVYSASAALNLPSIDISNLGQTAPPIYEAFWVALELPALQFEASGSTTGEIPTYTATADLVLPAIEFFATNLSLDPTVEWTFTGSDRVYRFSIDRSLVFEAPERSFRFSAEPRKHSMTASRRSHSFKAERPS